MKILVINCGSSSLKYQLIDMDTKTVLAKGLAERIGIVGSKLTHKPTGKDEKVFVKPMQNHADAMRILLNALIDPECGVIKDMEEIGAVGHRVVHAGEKYASSVLITDDVIAALEECIPLAPLHNPANIIGINACREILPDVPMVGVFDTAFHQTMPPEAYIYAIPYKYYEEYGIRKYGFHGTSHKYVAMRAAKLMNRDLSELKLITCHLGNGASISPILYGKSIDNSMGFTPMAGMAMGTRCGSIDPAIVKYIAQAEGKSLEEVDYILNNESGILGISGVSSDFRDLGVAVDEGNARAKLALNVFTYRAVTTIAKALASLNGVDGIVFTAGVGENSNTTRRLICDRLTFLGAKLDIEANKVRGEEAIISTPDSKVTLMVIPTNEELMIAMDTEEIVKNLK